MKNLPFVYISLVFSIFFGILCMKLNYDLQREKFKVYQLKMKMIHVENKMDLLKSNQKDVNEACELVFEEMRKVRL